MENQNFLPSEEIQNINNLIRNKKLEPVLAYEKHTLHAHTQDELLLALDTLLESGLVQEMRLTSPYINDKGQEVPPQILVKRYQVE